LNKLHDFDHPFFVVVDLTRLNEFTLIPVPTEMLNAGSFSEEVMLEII